MKNEPGPIGVFDSGYGGLTILKHLVNKLPNYSFMYLADNARAPYGSKSFDAIYNYTLQAVKHLFNAGCKLVILACNTASVKALRTIQQNDLQHLAPSNRVLGVVQPCVETIVESTQNGHIGILGTVSTVNSNTYIEKLTSPKENKVKTVTQEACPTWAALVEYGEVDNPGTDFFVQRHINSLFNKNPNIDTLALACTHYPLLQKRITKYVPSNVTILDQGPIVASKLVDYLKRHPEIDATCSKTKNCLFLTTENPDLFNQKASLFYNAPIYAAQISLA